MLSLPGALDAVINCSVLLFGLLPPNKQIHSLAQLQTRALRVLL